ncbi:MULTISPECIES: helix-turn-helix domain-containing protein [Phyllobacteriaceae]|jgi:AraC family transcriptional regulator, melibiose operon regulatory protein|uniref:AraC family transcriptional regulator n=1 Tax=Mesorhizobium hungaricum TaxID=1566387 RepID=A0A1C2E0R3_9HYPH|nr:MULTISPECIES: helix-turn-helix domain-containing protein [Mesorhizobium]MBN9235468.1 helix-turn-helix domain-containing protein [Mesorhizobium sp.]MDQ0331379.1 AraC-like DNA-binding protein/quercetin dioxygenase-like cupin family protein [Mesorhizobium sp. YL-MeA3-2017]OCX20620.1 AraC family transcriptional regulator [Mesorhizobium hungaricum]
MTKSLRFRGEKAFSVPGEEFLIERHIADTMAIAHWHNHVEINLLMKGRMNYLFNGRQEEVEAGKLVLFWAAIPHRTIDVSKNAPLICIYLPLVDFLGLSIDRRIRQDIMQGRFLTDPRPAWADTAQMSRWAQEWEEGKPTRRRLAADEVRLRVKRLVLDTLETPHIEHRPTVAPINSAAVQRAEALTELIGARHAGSLSLTKLAKLSGIHPSTANRTFREVLGVSVNEYLIRYRLAQAIQRLADTNDPVLQIAYDCGFGSSSRFYDLFKHRTGMTPKVFRARVGRAGAPDVDHD